MEIKLSTEENLEEAAKNSVEIDLSNYRKVREIFLKISKDSLLRLQTKSGIYSLLVVLVRQKGQSSS